jgi:hypothetical protein
MDGNGAPWAARADCHSSLYGEGQSPLLLAPDVVARTAERAAGERSPRDGLWPRSIRPSSWLTLGLAEGSGQAACATER